MRRSAVCDAQRAGAPERVAGAHEHAAIGQPGDDPGLDLASVLTVGLSVVCVVICFLKQRLWHGVIGFFVFPLALYGACRIGKPGSWWARRFYGERNAAKQAKAEQRFAPDRRTERLKERLRDAIGGATEEEYAAKVERRG